MSIRNLALGAICLTAAATPTATIAAAAAPSAAAVCDESWTTAAVNDGFPNRMSSLVGADIRTGRHECFERVVLELQGTGDLPGFQVRYEPDPILDSPRGEPVDIAGDATLVLSVGVWMTTMEGEGYQGPTEISPTNVSNIAELEMIENFEGQTAWEIGLDEERPFTVFTLVDPVRIVVDIALGGSEGGDPPTSLPPTR